MTSGSADVVNMCVHTETLTYTPLMAVMQCLKFASLELTPNMRHSERVCQPADAPKVLKTSASWAVAARVPGVVLMAGDTVR